MLFGFMVMKKYTVDVLRALLDELEEMPPDLALEILTFAKQYMLGAETYPESFNKE
jgi:hypothetical protein